MIYFIILVAFVWLIKTFRHNKLCNIPKPYVYNTITLNSNSDISEILGGINTLLPQLTEFINQFHDFVAERGINVITDSSGNMSIDVKVNVSDAEAEYISKKIGVLDRLINTRGEQLSELFKKGLQAEKGMAVQNPGYTSQLTDKLAEFNKLNLKYKH